VFLIKNWVILGVGNIRGANGQLLTFVVNFLKSGLPNVYMLYQLDQGLAVRVCKVHWFLHYEYNRVLG
jgi:hypothetical protein